MKNLNLVLLLLASLLINLPTKLPAQRMLNRNWSKNIAFPDSMQAGSSTLDGQGNIIVTGNTIVSPGNNALFAAKYNPTGNLLWSRQFQPSYGGPAFGVCTVPDGQGNLYLVGSGQGNSLQNQDIIVVKYNAAGALIWSKYFDGPSSGRDYPIAAMFSAGKLLLNGYSASGNGSADIWTMGLDAGTGAIEWENRYDFAGMDDMPGGMSLNNQGGVSIVGASRSGANTWEYVTLGYNTIGQLVQSNRIAGQGSNMRCPSSLVRDNAGDYYFPSQILAGGNSVVSVTKLNSNMQHLWTMPLGVTKSSEGNSLCLDAQGNVYITGFAKQGNGQREFIFASLDGQGNQRWLIQAPSRFQGATEGLLVKVSGNNEVYVAGRDAGISGKKGFFLCYDTSGNSILARDIPEYPGLPGEPVDIQVSGNEVYWVKKGHDGAASRISLTQFSGWEAPQNVKKDSTGHGMYMEGQLIVKFAPELMRPGSVDDREILFGDLADLVDQSIASEVKTRLFGSNAASLPVSKIFVGLSTTDTIRTSRTGKKVRIPKFWSTLILHLPPGMDEEWAENQLNDRSSSNPLFPRVRYACLNIVGELASTVPNDSLYATRQASLAPNLYSMNSHINVESAWGLGFKGDSLIKVGVFDSGIEGRHDDLSDANRSWAESKVKGGYDYNSNPPQQVYTLNYPDPNGHGTACAGIIGADRNNGIGIAGVAGGDIFDDQNRGVSLYSMNIFNNTLNTTQSMILASFFDGIVNLDLDVFSCSWVLSPFALGYSANSLEALREMTRFAHANEIILIYARGNNGQDILSYPASFYPDWQVGDDWTVSVGGSTYGGDRINYSNYGKQLDLIAPAQNSLVYTLDISQGSYLNFSGTSAATPHAAGVAALILDADSTLAPEDIEYLLEYGALDRDVPGYDQYTGHGLLQAGGGLGLLASGCQIVHFEAQPVGDSVVHSNYGLNMLADYDNVVNGPLFADIHRIEATVQHNFPPGYQILNTPGKPGYWIRSSGCNRWGSREMQDLLPENNAHFSGIPDEQSATLFAYYYDIRFQSLPFSIIPHTADPGHADYEQPILAYSLLVCPPVANLLEGNAAGLFDIYPNPSSTAMNVRYQIDAPGLSRLELLDLQGRVVNRSPEAQRPTGEHLFQFAVSDLAEGMYFCKLITNTGVYARRFIVVR
jgi:subtilisin family serine protease